MPTARLRERLASASAMDSSTLRAGLGLRDIPPATPIGQLSGGELTKLALRTHPPPTTSFDLVVQALLFTSQDKYERMTAFLERSRS